MSKQQRMQTWSPETGTPRELEIYNVLVFYWGDSTMYQLLSLRASVMWDNPRNDFDPATLPIVDYLIARRKGEAQ
jgi:hypothetical protein